MKALLYARVSSKEQEKEGFSIPAQCKLLRDYAIQNRFRVVEEYVDVETAKNTGRTNFGEMVKYLRKHPGVCIILVEKTDRLYRNLKDWVTLDELDVEIHLAKEGVVLSRDSRSSEKFMHGIKVLMAKNYIDNLSEEARKGQMEKAEQGIWPSKAPLGYLNVTASDGKKVIQPDPVLAPVVTKMFERYATGQYSIKALTKGGSRRWTYLTQERQSGAGEHCAHHSAQPALHRAVSMEWQAASRQARAVNIDRAMGTGARRVGGSAHHANAFLWL
ncbi:hypothetical protein AU467_23920 [Mesorhizobium loti]|uniref:Resolvase/invertase-type recombinase catalytic domain-containing protein n=1 Tax=Rhizobium loti TaxID=381 RepID=A0A101KS07_RHILI|nr:hypothetical protein AU467_23920 [Mesorhizobium loti]